MGFGGPLWSPVGGAGGPFINEPASPGDPRLQNPTLELINENEILCQGDTTWVNALELL